MAKCWSVCARMYVIVCVSECEWVSKWAIERVNVYEWVCVFAYVFLDHGKIFSPPPLSSALVEATKTMHVVATTAESHVRKLSPAINKPVKVELGLCNW